MNLITDESVTEFVEARTGLKFTPPYQPIGFQGPHGMLGVVANDFNGANIEFSFAADPGCFALASIKWLANYAFEVNGCRRVTIKVKNSNALAKKMAGRFGFKFEAVLRGYFPDDDAVMFRMTRAECPWLGEKHGKRA